MNKWVKWSALALLALLVVIGVAIAGYALRYRPLSGPVWSGAALDAYRLQYICISTREGRFNPIDIDAVVLHPFSCNGRDIDERFGIFPGCEVDDNYVQICNEPWWERYEPVPEDQLVPGSWLKKS